MATETDITINIDCQACGDELVITGTDYRNGYIQITTKPCPSCLDDARKEGKEEGREEAEKEFEAQS